MHGSIVTHAHLGERLANSTVPCTGHLLLCPRSPLLVGFGGVATDAQICFSARLICVMLLLCRHEKVEVAKREIRKKHELERRFGQDGEGNDLSDDSDVDEDKIMDEEEAGEGFPSSALCRRALGGSTDAIVGPTSHRETM